jgi:hypothetical protein
MNPTTIQPWYENQEATQLLLKAAIGGVEYKSHRRQYAITADEWSSAEGPIADRLKDIYAAAGELGLALQDADYEAGIRHALREGPFEESGYHVSVEAAIEAIQIAMDESGPRQHWTVSQIENIPEYLTDLGLSLAKSSAGKARLAA